MSQKRAWLIGKGVERKPHHHVAEEASNNLAKERDNLKPKLERDDHWFKQQYIVGALRNGKLDTDVCLSFHGSLESQRDGLFVERDNLIATFRPSKVQQGALSAEP